MAEQKTNPTKNSYHCFGLRDILVMIFVITIALTPLLSILFLRLTTDYNAVNWNEYYNDGDTFDSTVSGTFVDKSKSFTDQLFRVDNKYLTFNIPLQAKNSYQTVSFGSRQYRFVMNGSSDIVYTSQYTFDPQNIYLYYPFMYGLPISLTIGYNYTYFDHFLGVYDTQINVTEASIIIPSNWSTVWDNTEIYFYYIDDNNDGFAFTYGKNQSVNDQFRLSTLSTVYGNLSLRVYDLNMSGVMSYWNKAGINDPQFIYHNKPLENNSYLFEYLQLLFGSISTDPSTVLEPFLQMLGIQRGIGLSLSDFYTAFAYDNTLMEARQIYGYPDIAQFPSFYATKCGYHIKIGQNFNITGYLNNFSSTFLMDNIADPTYHKSMMNGINIYDGGLYLGKITTLIQKLQTVLMYDLVVIFSILTIISLIAIVTKYPDKLLENKKAERMMCRTE